MSKYKDSSAAGNSSWKIGAVVTVSLAAFAAKHWWSCRQLNRKLERKRESCRKTLKKIEQEMQQSKLSEAERVAIVSLPLSALQSKLKSGELTAMDVLRAYQHKVLEVNANIKCVTDAITEAQEQAAACDRTSDKSLVLHGVPLSLKDNIGVKGYDMTGGLQCNIGIPATEDAVIVQVFKRHGAVPFVKTNIPQAMLSYACINSIFGSTLNPHNSKRTPGGSSGGEGAALGAGGSIIGLGTDVGGSVRAPANFCGVCALKPTSGRFSKVGVYSVTKGQTIIGGVTGPMARDVESLVVMTRIMASPDMFELDPSVPPLPFQEQLLKSTHKLKIGYYTWDGISPSVPAVCRAVREATSALEALGHTVVEFNPPEFPEMFFELFVSAMLAADKGQTIWNAVKRDYVEEAMTSVRLARLPHWLLSLMAWMARRKEPVMAKLLDTIQTDGRTFSWFRKVSEIMAYRIRFTKKWKAMGLDAVICPAFPILAEPVMAKLLDTIQTDGRTFSWFRKVSEIMAYRIRFTKKWKAMGLDAVICPAFPCPAPSTADIGKMTVAGAGLSMYNVLDFTAGTVPVTKVTAQDVADVNNPKLFHPSTLVQRLLKKSCDTEDSIGLPLGVQCVTLPFTEELCLRVMGELEAAVNYKSL